MRTIAVEEPAGRAFLDSALLTVGDKEAVAHGNAERLLHLPCGQEGR